MRRAVMIFIIYCLFDIGFAAWKEWDAYYYNVIGDAYIILHGIFITIFLVICCRGIFVDRTLRVVSIYAALIIFTLSAWFFPYHLEMAKMKIRAEVFVNFPTLCQINQPSSPHAFVCYRYSAPMDFSGQGPVQWLVMGHDQELSLTPDLWPDDIKRLFVGSKIKKIPVSMGCYFGKVKKVSEKMYWISNNCNDGRLIDQ
jgi:hypothetical protein